MNISQPKLLTTALLPKLPPRALDAHKGLFGHALIIGGDYGTGGAPLLAAQTALRTGTGLVSIATRPTNTSAILAHCPELMSSGISSANQLIPLINKASVLAIGMGLGQSAWSQSLLSTMTNTQQPQVWDADALNLLSQNPHILPKNAILTPHLGEAARLLNCDIATIEKDKATVAIKLMQKYQATIVLKGRGTLIANLKGDLILCDHGHPAMAGAGFGDVLSGLITSLLAQHLPPYEAAILAVWLHAQAGEVLGKQGRGLLASDLIPIIRQLLEKYSPCLA